MLSVADDHKSSGANVPFTARPPLISDPIPGWRTLSGRPGGGGGDQSEGQCDGGVKVSRRARRAFPGRARR